mmetsp:Transcript_24675/g.51278  ORF Transcript_24675/g.51278 Transcript_24675/m.51278 type:complete len:92 (-) Transcript_24675:169-444(-)
MDDAYSLSPSAMDGSYSLQWPRFRQWLVDEVGMFAEEVFEKNGLDIAKEGELSGKDSDKCKRIGRHTRAIQSRYGGRGGTDERGGARRSAW